MPFYHNDFHVTMPKTLSKTPTTILESLLQSTDVFLTATVQITCIVPCACIKLHLQVTIPMNSYPSSRTSPHQQQHGHHYLHMKTRMARFTLKESAMVVIVTMLPQVSLTYVNSASVLKDCQLNSGACDHPQ